MRFAQGWSELGQRTKAVVRIVTRGVFKVTPSDHPMPWGASLLGLGKVMERELPGVSVCCVDLPGDFDPIAAAQWLASESAETADWQVSWRGGRRYVRGLRSVDLPRPATIPFRDRGVYLVAGGAGGLGMATARMLAGQAHARIALVGRSPASAREPQVREIEGLGGEAMYCQADLTNTAEVRAAVAQIKRRWGAIHGAFHSAIVLEDCSLARMTEAKLRAALDPKTEGSRALADALKGESLDFLAFFSSANSFSANAGQANYVAGCVFKDAFAQYLADQGINARVINWGYWGEIGIVATPEMRARLAKAGLFSIHEAEGMDAVVRVLSRSALLPMKCSGNWERAWPAALRHCLTRPLPLRTTGTCPAPCKRW